MTGLMTRGRDMVNTGRGVFRSLADGSIAGYGVGVASSGAFHQLKVSLQDALRLHAPSNLHQLGHAFINAHNLRDVVIGGVAAPLAYMGARFLTAKLKPLKRG